MNKKTVMRVLYKRDGGYHTAYLNGIAFAKSDNLVLLNVTEDIRQSRNFYDEILTSPHFAKRLVVVLLEMLFGNKSGGDVMARFIVDGTNMANHDAPLYEVVSIKMME